MSAPPGERIIYESPPSKLRWRKETNLIITVRPSVRIPGGMPTAHFAVRDQGWSAGLRKGSVWEGARLTLTRNG